MLLARGKWKKKKKIGCCYGRLAIPVGIFSYTILYCPVSAPNKACQCYYIRRVFFGGKGLLARYKGEKEVLLTLTIDGASSVKGKRQQNIRGGFSSSLFPFLFLYLIGRLILLEYNKNNTRKAFRKP